MVEPIAEWLHRRSCHAALAYVVVVTRGHQHDLDAMRALAARDLRYLGLIGSRAKVARIFDALDRRGHAARMPRPRPRPDRLDIGAVTPAEIAISILAELIAVRRGVDSSALSMARVGIKSATSDAVDSDPQRHIVTMNDRLDVVEGAVVCP